MGPAYQVRSRKPDEIRDCHAGMDMHKLCTRSPHLRRYLCWLSR